MNVDLNKYSKFVEGVTSDESNKFGAMVSEGGEYAEIVKKCIFQGKPLDDDTKFHIKRELGDIIWYWVNSCRALDIDPNEVIAENVAKLKSRYPGGEFDVHHSENRKDGDL